MLIREIMTWQRIAFRVVHARVIGGIERIISGVANVMVGHDTVLAWLFAPSMRLFSFDTTETITFVGGNEGKQIASRLLDSHA